jgi:molybdopterin-containing oxidoreductase family membrane subunit
METTLKRMFWIAGGIMFTVGAFGWWDRMANGHLNANYGSIVPWGLWVAAYIFFIGLSAGSFLISALVYVFGVKKFEPIGRVALFTALITLTLALLSIWVDLGHMFRAQNVYLHPNFKSPMAWMIWLYSAYIVLIASELWFLLRRDLATGARGTGPRATLYKVLSLGSKDTSEESELRDRKVVKVLATIGVPVAIMFHGGVGALFGVVAARPGWNSGLFPILFLLSALTSGGALLMLVAAIFQGGYRRNADTIVALGRLVLGLLLLDILFQVSEYLIASYGGVPGHIEGLKLIFAGPYWWVFWVWQLAIGTFIPILILASKKGSNALWAAGAGGLIALGFIGVRLNIVIPALATEEIAGLTDAIANDRISTDYFPSVMEWLVTIGIVGLGMLLFGLGEMLLPGPTRATPEVAGPAKEVADVRV